MKKIIITVGILFISNLSLLADSGYVVFTPGGNVEPVQHDSIRMKNEQVNITLYDDQLKVRVDYWFENTGNRQKVVMGFPNSKDFDPVGKYIYGINDFKAFDGKKELKVFRKDKEGEKGKHPSALYECFKVQFNKGETKQITNTYSQKYNSDNDDNIFTGYILRTGASWKGDIGNIKIIIKSELLPERMKKKTGYFIEECDKCEIIKVDYDFSISPKKYSINNNIIKMEFNNIEPDFDIKIFIPSKTIKSVSASSELKSKNNKYSVKNLVDGNPETPWVEGKKGYGINESIVLSTNPFYANSAGAYKISRIGIINGYAKNASIFKKNSRVKKIRIDYKNYACCGNCCKDKSASMKENGSEVFTLKDTMEIQYLKFDEPVFTSNIKITILNVYKGSKWDDTCLSEIMLFTDD